MGSHAATCYAALGKSLNLSEATFSPTQWGNKIYLINSFNSYQVWIVSQVLC